MGKRFVMGQVTVKAMWRRRGASLLLAAVAAAGVCAAMVLHNLTVRQERALEDTINNTTISCVVTNAQGTGTGQLQMFSAFVEMLLGLREERGCYLGDYVKNVRAKATFSLEVPEGASLRRILSLDSDPALSPAEGARVEFYEGWSETVLSTRQQVCLVGEDMLTQDGYLNVSNGLDDRARLQIVGVVYGGPPGAVYCPFFMPWVAGTSVSFLTETCSFDIRDNRKLEESKGEIYTWFVEPALTNQMDGLTFGVLVQDETYLDNLAEIQSNLSMLRILLPVLLVMCAGIGCFASYLTTRGRIREFAVMRCLGMKQRRVFGLVFGEQMLLAGIGGALGLAVGVAVEGGLSPAALAKAGLLIAVFLAGSAIAVLGVTRVNVMKLMKVEE